MSVLVFWVVTPCGPVCRYQCFWQSCCLHLQRCGQDIQYCMCIREDGGSVLFQNVGNCLQVHTALLSRRWEWTSSTQWNLKSQSDNNSYELAYGLDFLWRWPSYGLLRRVIWQKFTDVSEVITSISLVMRAAIISRASLSLCHTTRHISAEDRQKTSLYSPPSEPEIYFLLHYLFCFISEVFPSKLCMCYE
jgi:hypothetical protein